MSEIQRLSGNSDLPEKGNDVILRSDEDAGPATISGRGFTDGFLMHGTRVGEHAGWAATEHQPGSSAATVVLYGMLPVSLPVQHRIPTAEL